MKNLRRVLALLLVFAMLMPNLTTIASAVDTGEDSAIVNTEPAAAQETEAPTEAPTETPTESPTEAPTEAPVEEPTEAITEPSVEETEPVLTQNTVTVEETVTSPAANELTDAELVTRTVTVEDTAAPASDYSNDDMFAMYVDRILYPDKPATLGTGGFDNLPDKKHQNLYTFLKNKLKSVADKGGSTELTISAEELSEMGFPVHFTAAELDITGRIDVTEEKLTGLVGEKLALDLDALIGALLADCPYELYWYDKTIGCYMDYRYTWWSYDTGEITEVAVDDMFFGFIVASDYRDGSAYTVRSDYAAQAAKTVEYAQAVVTANAEKSDYEKLNAYKDYICAQVSYNWDAASNTYTGGYGDPWQIIYVFDGNTDTNVVCEGYSKAFQYLCDLSTFDNESLECFLVTGNAGGPHMWNIVSIDGRNYLVDVTNTDPDGVENWTRSIFLAGAEGSLEKGYTFADEFGNECFYEYTIVDADGVTWEEAFDVYGTGEDSILNLSFLGYEKYLEYSAAQDELTTGADLAGDHYIVDDVDFRGLGEVSGANLTVSGAALKLTGRTELQDCTITLEDGARFQVQGELYLKGESKLIFGDNTYLEIDGDQDNRQGTIFVQDASEITMEDTSTAYFKIPEGAIYVDFDQTSDLVSDVAAQKPKNLTVQTTVSDQSSLENAISAMAIEAGEEPDYCRYELIISNGFEINHTIDIPGHTHVYVYNWNDENDPAVITVKEDAALTIDGCYFGLYEGTQLRVEGSLVNRGYLRTHDGSSVNITGTGTLTMMPYGHMDNRGIVYAPNEDYIEYQEGYIWDNNAPIFASQEQESYITLRFLDNDGHGHWYESEDSDLHKNIGMAPGDVFWMAAYLNVWNGSEVRWEVSPIHASKLVTDASLVLVPFEQITDGNNQVLEGENFDAFFKLYPAENAEFGEGATASITYSNTEIGIEVNMGRFFGGFYSADPTADGAVADDLWLNHFVVSESNKKIWFYFDADKYHDTGWTLSSLSLSADRNIGSGISYEAISNNLCQVTLTDELAKNIYSLREFRLIAHYVITKGEETRQESSEIWCRAAEFGEPAATFEIDGQRYHASWNYDGLFRFEGEEGEQYPVPASLKGVSYDIHSNTLTLNNADLDTLHINNYWHDDGNGEEGWDLPNGHFTINLEGTNTISATDDFALRAGGDMHLVITGNGTLNLSMTGGSTNTCQHAVEFQDADFTIEGDARVTISVSGISFEETEDGLGEQRRLAPIRGHGEGRRLCVRENATLTTNVPEGVCINGSFAESGTFIEAGGFDGIIFCDIEVCDNATLNTQTIGVWDEGLNNAYGHFYLNGGTVNISGIPYYNADEVSEDGTVGHYHFSGLEADYGKIEINGGDLNIDIQATDAQMEKSVYYHALQSRGRYIALNGGTINVTGNISGTGIKVGEDNWDGGTNAWVDFNGTTLNMTGSNLYRSAVDVAPNGSINFNGGQINAHRADITIRGSMQWNGTRLDASACALQIVEGGQGQIHGGQLTIQNGRLLVDNQYDEDGNLIGNGCLEIFGGELKLDNSFVTVVGALSMEGGAMLQTLDFRKLTTDESFAQAFYIGANGDVSVDGDAYLEINGVDKTDGIYNEGFFRIYDGNVVIDVDESIEGATAFFGPGYTGFMNGNVYLDGYNALVQFNRDDSSILYVGGDTMLNAIGRTAGIITYARAVFNGGYVHAHAHETVGDHKPVAVMVKNDEDGTNASLTIKGGSHYFEVFDNATLAENGVGLSVVNAPVTFEGGELDIEAATAVVAEGSGSVTVPKIISNETGAVLVLTYHDTLKANTLMVEGDYARSVAFRMSQSCGENATWSIGADGTLTISGTGDMADYHMPINDPASWRTAPWYTMRDVITKVVVQEGITGIGDWAFGRLPKVTEISYPSTVTSIDMTSGYACPQLTKITVAEGNKVYSVSEDGKVLIENGSLVLAAVKTIQSYTAGDEIRTIGMGAFDSTDLQEVVLNQVQEIQNYAFADCYNLKSVIIPDGVSTINITVFQNSGLESITIPSSVAKIRNYAFDGCAALANVTFTGTESQWNSIAIGSGNNALLYAPITFQGEVEEIGGDPYLSYRLLTFGDQGYYENTGDARTEMTIPVGYYPAMVVYLNVWNPDAEQWERWSVDPEQLYGVADLGDPDNHLQDLEIGPFRYYDGIGIEEGEPNAWNFFEMAFHSGWGTTKYLCYKLEDGKVASMPVTLTRSQVGFYSEDPTSMTQDQRNAAWLNYYPINPNVSGDHSVYFALTEYNGNFSSVEVSSDRLSAEDMAKVTVTKINGSVYQITLPDELAAKIYEYRGIPIQVTYTIPATETTPAEEGTVEFIFGSVSFAGECYSFVINGVWYEYYPGLEGYFSWDDEKQMRCAHKELPGGITYDYDSDTLTMNDSEIKSLQVYWNWHDEQTGNSGFATKDSDLTLKLIGENKIINPGSDAALAVGDGLTLTITGDENSSLLISSTNEHATADNFSQNAVSIYNGADLVIAGSAQVTTSISSNEDMTEGWLMNLWGGGNTLTIKDNASLTTTVPDGARDDGDGYVDGYEGIGWFGEVKVQDNATLNTSSFGLGEYYDEHGNFHGKGSYVQTGGTVTIEALGHKNEEGRHNYNGFTIDGGTTAEISGGTLTVKANAKNVAADNPGEEGTTYAWFSGINVTGDLKISGEHTVVEIQLPENGDGNGIELNHGAMTMDNGTLQFTGNGQDNYALQVNWGSRFWLNGGLVDVTDAKVRIQGDSENYSGIEICDGILRIEQEEYPARVGLDINECAEFVLHGGEVTVDQGLVEGNSFDAVHVDGEMHLNGGTMHVTGNKALSVGNCGNLYQNGTDLTVNGVEMTLASGDGANIYLNGGNTIAMLGKKVVTGEDGGNIDLSSETGVEYGTVINSWYSVVNVYKGSRLQINDGHHSFLVAGTPGTDENGTQVWLSALDVSGSVNFNGGKVLLDAGTGGQSIFNRNAAPNTTVWFNNNQGAVAPENGTSLAMYSHGQAEDDSEYYYALGTAENQGVSKAVIMQTSAGHNSSWRIEKDGGNTVLYISGSQDMYNFYMPDNDSDWEKTPWFDYNDQITHVVVEDGINHIGDWVFARMTNLVNVKLPGSVNHISTSAFYGCTNLKSFTMPGNDNYRLDEQTATGPDENGCYTGTVIIEGGWKVLKAAPSVTAYQVPDFISEIGNGAFQNCANLATLTFETNEDNRSNVHTVGNNAFENTGLTSVDLPEGIQAIGGSAFYDCGNVTKISLPASVNTIRPYAFSGCGTSTVNVTYAGNVSDWAQIAIGNGNDVLTNVVCTGDEVVSGKPYLSFRWLSYGENGWEESKEETINEFYMPAGSTNYIVFYHNYWDEDAGKWIAEAVIPTPADNSGITITPIEELLTKYEWEIADGEKNSACFVMICADSQSWDGETNYGIIAHNDVVMDIHIQRGNYGFYSSETASNETWLNDYELNPLKPYDNVFYFIFEKSENEIMKDDSFHIWNHNGIPDYYIRTYDVGEGVFKIVLDPVFMQDAWAYGHGFQLFAGFDVIDGEGNHQRYEETNFQLMPMNLGEAEAVIKINDKEYFYFPEGWMTNGDSANDWRPGVGLIPAGVSYSYNPATGEQILTLNNAKLNNLSLCYKVLNENGDPTGETRLPGENLTINLEGNSVIESGHRSALNIDGNLNVTVKGDGSLYLHSHNSPNNYREDGQPYAFDTLEVENGSKLTISGGAVTAEISGEGYWNQGQRAMPAALRGRNGSHLVINSGTLTTKVPDNARDNGPDEIDFEDYYSTHAIGEFASITVSGGILNTTSLYINNGESYTQTGGEVNITGLGHLSRQWDEYGNERNNYHYNGLQIQEKAEASISGGTLNLTVTPKDWEHGSSYYNGISIAGSQEVIISGTANIHVTGAYDGNIISVHHEYDEHGNSIGNGSLTMTGGTVTAANTVPGSHMIGVEVREECSANITGGTLYLTPENSYAGIHNDGTLTLGKDVTVNLNQEVWSNGQLTINGANVSVTHAADEDMYAWDIVPGTSFDFVSGTIEATNAAFMIGGEMNIGEDAVLKLTDSDFHADGAITLNGSLTMIQNDLVDNKFLGTKTDEWGNTWEEYEHQSRLYVTGELNLNSGNLTLKNVPVNVEGSAVVNQYGAEVSITNATAAPETRGGNGYDTDDWMVSVRVGERATVNVSGGTFSMTNTNFDTGLESNGPLNIRGGALTIDNPTGFALASQGQTYISGGEVILSGDVGYHLWDEEGFENGKLTISGGTVDIDAVNTGIDLYNDLVITGGVIDIDVTGYTRSFTNENGVPVNMKAGCGIMGYNDNEKINISINGGSLDINAPVEAPADVNAMSVFGILGGKNTTVRINGGDVGIQARVALYAESNENPNHILVNNRLHVLSLDTGNTLNSSSGSVDVERDGETVTWYVDTYEEDEVFTSPYNNDMMADYATNVRIVSKTAGKNASWDMENGVLTISAPSGTVGTMAKTAGWNHAADKVTKLILDPSITQPEEFSGLFPNLKTVKTPHDSKAEAYAKKNSISIEYFHEPKGDKKCTVEGCALATFISIVEDAEKTTAEKVTEVQTIPNTDLQQELEASQESAEQFESLDEQVKQSNENLKVVVKADETTEGQSSTIAEILGVSDEAAKESKIVGAAMNAEETTKEVALVIGEPSTEKEFDTTKYEKVVSFSMELTTTTTAEEETEVEDLKTPVQITLPLPSDMDVNRLVILHYTDSDVMEEVSFIHTEVNGQVFVSFWVSGFSDFDFRMTSRTLHVVMKNQSMTYGGEIPDLTYQVQDEDGNAVTDYADQFTITPKVDTTAAGPLNAGTYTITADITKTDANCNVQVKPAVLTVAKQKITVTMDDQEMTIGNDEPQYTYQVSDELPSGITITPKVGPITKAGEYPITAEPVEYANYAVTIQNGTLTVNKQSVIITMDAKSMKAGGIQPELTYTVTDGTGYALADHGLDITPKIESFNAGKGGIYTITAFVEKDDRYTADIKTAEMTVVEDITVTVSDVTINVDQTPTFDFTVPEGVDKEAVKLTFTVKDADGNVVTEFNTAGEYTITATPTEGENPFYNITVVDGKLTVVEPDDEVNITSYKNGWQTQIGLIEPWFLRVNVTIADQSFKQIDYSNLTDYGFYFARASHLDVEGTPTVEQLIADSDVVEYTKDTIKTQTAGAYTYFYVDYNKGLYTYEMSDSLYVTFYFVEGDGERQYTMVREQNLKELLDARKNDDTKFSELEREVYHKMSNLETDIVAYREGKTDTATKMGQKLVGGMLGTPSTDVAYKFGVSTQVVLIEPWGLQVNAAIVPPTGSGVADHVDYASVDDYGVVMYYDVDGTAEELDTPEEMLALTGSAYVFSRNDGSAFVSTSNPNFITARYNQNVFTYQLDTTVYALYYVKINGNYYYSTVRSYNVHDMAYERGNDISFGDELERAVYLDMVGLYGAITAYREDYFKNH